MPASKNSLTPETTLSPPSWYEKCLQKFFRFSTKIGGQVVIIAYSSERYAIVNSEICQSRYSTYPEHEAMISNGAITFSNSSALSVVPVYFVSLCVFRRILLMCRSTMLRLGWRWISCAPTNIVQLMSDVRGLE